MKTSYFNIYLSIREEESLLVYNTFSGAFAKIVKEDVKIAQALLSNPNIICDSNEINRLKESLSAGGFIIDNHTDEIKILKLRNRLGRYQRKLFGLTIAPTLDCNFRCDYCYELLKNTTMSKETEENIILFAKRGMKEISVFRVNWYGGEPLLRFDVISRLTEKFILICNDRNIEYSAGMITNGYLLNKDVIKVLDEYLIKNIQITVDGPRYIHDKRRILASGEPTFDIIMSNLEKVIKKSNAIINLRINIDKDNHESVLEFIESLKYKQLLNKVNVYLAPIQTCFNHASDYQHKCISYKEFIDVETKVFNKLSAKDIIIKNIPTQKNQQCIADTWGCFAVDPEGFLYKCYADIGEKEHSVGHITDTECIKSRFYEYLVWDPFDDKKCKKCIFLPICMGGCTRRRMSKSRNYSVCSKWKYRIIKSLEAWYTNYQSLSNDRQTRG
ncbi:MAG: SPASM domain-containing protein [Acidobacteriota bacterium]|nr:SPASM domain-containing protein [Acidobacteriota bacterium]